MNGDEEIKAMLRAADKTESGARLDERRTSALHARIMAGAADRLAELRRQRTVWDYSARWSRAAVPVAVAASILAGALWVRVTNTTAPDVAPTVAVTEGDAARRVIRDGVIRTVATTDMLDSLVGPVSSDALMAGLLGGAR
jgi:hypothetical protein